MKVSRIAGEGAMEPSSSKSASWKDTMKNDRFITLPNHNLPVDTAPPAATVNKPPPKANY